MRIVLPVTRHDADQFRRLVSVMVKLGGLNRQVITILPSPSQMDLAEQMAGQLKPLCDEIDVMPMMKECNTDAWPQNPNAMWRFAAMQLVAKGSRLPWFWMEADCIPIKEGWADKLDVAYAKCGKEYLGNVIPTPFRYPDGSLAPYKDGDDMMMGCAIYSPDAPKHCDVLFNDLRDADQSGIDVPWDIYLRWCFKQYGREHTPLIGDFWQTERFRIDAGELKCELRKPEQLDIKRRKTVVPSECYLVHGCKDSTLASLVLSDGINKVVEKKPEQQGAVLSVDMARLWQRIEALDERIAKLEQLRDAMVVVQEAKTETATNAESSVITVDFAAQVDQQQNPGAGISGGIIKQLRDGKKMRVADAMKSLGVGKEEALTFLKENGFKMGKAGWIQADN